MQLSLAGGVEAPWQAHRWTRNAGDELRCESGATACVRHCVRSPVSTLSAATRSHAHGQASVRKTLACATLPVQLFEYRSVRYWSKEINGTRTGGRKRKFLDSRRRGGRGHRAAAPVKSCRSPPKRCPWGRPGSVLYTCKRLRRIRRRFKHFWSISLSRPRSFSSFSEPG